jgi:hypothetical protein
MVDKFKYNYNYDFYNSITVTYIFEKLGEIYDWDVWMEYENNLEEFFFNYDYEIALFFIIV